MKNWFDSSQVWRIGTKLSQMWRIGTKSSHVWIIGTKSSHLWKMVSNHHKRKIRTCEELVPNPHTSEKLVPNYHRWEILVLNRHRWQWQNCAELESSAKCSRFGGIFQCEESACMLYEIWLRAYCSQSVRYCYEVCDILVPIFLVLWGFGTNSS